MSKNVEIQELINELHAKEFERRQLTRQIGSIKSKITMATKPIVQNYVYEKYNGQFLSKDDVEHLQEYISDLKGHTKYISLMKLLNTSKIKFFVYFNGDYPLFYITNGKGKYQLLCKSTGEIIYEGFAEESYASSWYDDYLGKNENLNKVSEKLFKINDWIFKEIT